MRKIKVSLFFQSLASEAPRSHKATQLGTLQEDLTLHNKRVDVAPAWRVPQHQCIAPRTLG